jgi:hypothetical protein
MRRRSRVLLATKSRRHTFMKDRTDDWCVFVVHMTRMDVFGSFVDWRTGLLEVFITTPFYLGSSTR